MQRRLFPLSYYRDLLRQNGLLASARMAGDPTVALVTCHSQEAGAGTLFICKGAHFKPAYWRDAEAAGAIGYVSETAYPAGDGVSCLLVTDIRRAMSLLADAFYQQAWKELSLIGITGTKGKSSTAYYVKYILDDYLQKNGKPASGILSSIDTYDGVIFEESHLTTPEPPELHRHFFNAVSSGIPYMEMEVSSQALKYGRVSGVTFDVGCFLNIGRDHISAVEHPDFEDYFASKCRLLAQSRVGCVCLDSDRADEVLQAASACERVITFGCRPDADVYGYDIRKDGSHIRFRVKTADFDRSFLLTMPGLFNVQNALAAIAVATALGIPADSMAAGLENARVSGRMEIYESRDRRITAIVDYAHNRLSFEKLFDSVAAEYPDHKIAIVFGCPGNKAQERRRDLGEIAGDRADLVIITEEDAGEEPLDVISAEILAHASGRKAICRVENDRGKAIRDAVLSGMGNTVVLITGKGNETRQKRGIVYVPCPTDVDYVKEALEIYQRNEASE